ncbi:MAG: hypothetical protein IT307_16805, partial [Chloroflexi bacterium]|nr:hypothetical protein [Chloroflexota bacterium]
MPFEPRAGDDLVIRGVLYRVAEHPGAPGLPLSHEGVTATAYRLAEPGNAARAVALKVFRPRFRIPSLTALPERLDRFAEFAGLSACRFAVLEPRRDDRLLARQPDLAYAMLMPWVEGPAWSEVVEQKRPLDAAQSASLARALTNALVTLEQYGVAHCQLSGSSVLLPSLARRAAAEMTVGLVDVEQLFGPGLTRPEVLPPIEPGYAHAQAEGAWEPRADRFAGAVVLAEMLGWCDERVRARAWGQSYFAPHETQVDGERYRLLLGVVGERWGDRAAALLDRAWQSRSLADCATFGEWLLALPEAPAPARPAAPPPSSAAEPDDQVLRALLEAAAREERVGHLLGALELYRQAQALAPAGSRAAAELAAIVARLEALTGEGPASGAQPPRWAPAPEPRWAPPAAPERPVESEPAAGTAELFDAGLTALDEGRLAAARELLTMVAQQDESYARDGRTAVTALAEVERKLAEARRPAPAAPPRGGRRLVAGIVGA